MDRALARFVLVAWLAIVADAAIGAQQAGASGYKAVPDESSYRIIVSVADRGAELSLRELLEKKVLELSAKLGVLEVKALPNMGMAVIACKSLEMQEQLMMELEEDPLVELATPDTWAHLDDTNKRAGPDHAFLPREPVLDPLRQCSEQPRCAALGLVGKCCPAIDGLMLACCDQALTQNVVAFQSFHGKYIMAEADGTANANGTQLGAQEKFELVHNSGGTISLRSHFGKYVSAEAWGGVSADRLLINDWEELTLVLNNDSTVSLKTFHGTYFSAGVDGRLNADRRVIKDWERFTMHYVEDATERFPDDTNFPNLWAMYNEEDTDIDAPEAWKSFTGEPSAGIVVAVIDSGVDYNHEDLWQNMWTNPGEIPGNNVDDDNNGFIDDVYGADFVNEDGDPMDDQLHGTHCAGTIAGIGDNALGVTGVAWRGVRLMALKFLDDTGHGKISDAVKAIEYAIANGAKILSNSWGSGGSSAALRVAIDRAEAAGILFVAAAGNSGRDTDRSPHYPSSYPAESIISVASTNRKGQLSSFSCYGEESVDLAAPGSGIYSTVPRQQYMFLSGTSMAAPHVSGLAALVWMYRPALRMQQVKEVIMSSVDHLEALEGRMVTGGRINAKKALDMAASMEPRHPPIHVPRAIAFKDNDLKAGVISGVVTITAAADESDVEYYKVYWLSSAGYQLDAVGSVSANGSKLLEVPFPRSVVPKYAVSLVAVSGNATGEVPAKLGLVPNVTVLDMGVPVFEPLAVEWKGDEDLRAGIVAGTLSVARAQDESSITQYNIYWSERSGSRGPLLGSIPAAAFQAPMCEGPSCSLIGNTSTIGKYQFERRDYKINERATITLTGPGTFSVTYFDTEHRYDTLIVGSSKLSGRPRVPVDGKLVNGPMSIKWLSDDRVTAGGWAIEVLQSEATAEFRINAGPPLGRGLEVVPAYHGTEMHRGMFVVVADCNRSMPPSPAFAPTAVRFADVDGGKGVVAGMAEVTQAEGAVANGSVAYYQVNFADAAGVAMGQGWRLEANGSGVVLIPIAATQIPQGAVTLIVRAGNSFGLGVGRATADLDDFVGGQSKPAVLLKNIAQLSAGAVHLAAQAADTLGGTPSAGVEAENVPWRSAARGEEEWRVVWSAASAAARDHKTRGARVLSAITVTGLKADFVAMPEIRVAVGGAVLAALPRLEEDVRITRVLAAQAESSIETGRLADAALVEFEVEAAHSAVGALDRIEARLILLSKGGSIAKHLEKLLFAEFVKLGAKLPWGLRTGVRAPQQLAAPRRGRLLAASAPKLGHDSRHPGHLRPQSGSAGLASKATALPGFAAMSILGSLLLLISKHSRRSMRNGGELPESLRTKMGAEAACADFA